MKSRRGILLGGLFAGSLLTTLAAVAVSPSPAAAAGTRAKGATAAKGAPAGAAEAPSVNSLTTMLDGLKWGMNHGEVTSAYNKVGGLFDQEYNVLLAKTQPGVQMRSVEADRDARKAAFERSFLEFKDTPTGYDATALKGEYTYRNRESIQVVDKGGKKRFFFYIGAPPGERLWKIYDEVPLTEGGPYGASYQEAVTKLQAWLGVAARVRGADPDKGIMATTADWQDGATHLRAVDRSGQHLVGIVLEERNTLSNLANLRSHKADDPLALDPSIQAITRGGVADPNANAPAPSGSAAPKKK